MIHIRETRGIPKSESNSMTPGIMCVYVLDKGGQRYTAAWNAGAYLLLDPALGIVAISKQFDRILQALKDSL